MAVKECFRRFQPVQLYLVLIFTTTFFIVELVASHFTHALTLLVNAYHMLCNIVALIGCIASFKYAYRERYDNNGNDNCAVNSTAAVNQEGQEAVDLQFDSATQSRSDRHMKNTFGWARIDIVTMLVCCVFLASFCFSLLVEAMQTLIHIDHLDEMHHPLLVMCIGAAGILLNVLCYMLIGGYTFHQGIYLHVTKNGDVVLRRTATAESPSNEEQQLSTQKRRGPLALSKSPGIREIFRDVVGCVFVIVASVLVYFTDLEVAKFVDPTVAIISAVTLFVLSYPYMKESGLILLQTIPNHINIDSLKRDLQVAFPGIVNVHDLHVWQLTGEKVISTVHIIFLDPMVYASISDQVTAFFVEMGITQVTIQPEFHKMKPLVEKIDCLIRCQGEGCSESQCCAKETTLERSKKHIVSKKLERKEIVPGTPPMGLQKFTRQESVQREASDESERCKQSNVDEASDAGASSPCADVRISSNYGVCTVNVDVNPCADKTTEDGDSDETNKEGEESVVI